MIKTLAICMLCLTSLSVLTRAQEPRSTPDDPAKAALIEEMMHLTRPDTLMTQFLEQYKAAFSKGLEDSFRSQLIKSNEDAAKYQPEIHRFEDQMFNLVADRMSWDKMRPNFVTIYDETFSKQELMDIVAFYKTPSGQTLLQKMPELIAKGSQLGQVQMSGALEEVQKLTAQFISDLTKARSRATTPVEKQ